MRRVCATIPWVLTLDGAFRGADWIPMRFFFKTRPAGERPGQHSLVAAVALTTLVQMMATCTVFGVAAVAPAMARDLGVASYWVGYQVSLVYLASALASAYAGALVHSLGAVRTEQAALAGCACGLACLGSGSLALVGVGSLVLGVGYGLVNPAASHILSRVVPPSRRNFVFSLKQTGVPLGGVVAGFVFPSLAQAWDWRAAFWVALPVPVLLAWALQRGREQADADRGQARAAAPGLSAQQRLLWGQPQLRALALSGLCYSCLQLSLIAFMVTMLVVESGWSVVAAGSLLAAVQACGAVGRLAWGALADRMRSGFPLLGWMGLGACLCSALTIWLPDLPTVWKFVLLCAFGAFSIGWNGVMLAEVARNSPKGEEGAVTGAVLVYVFGGVVVGPAVFSVLYAAVGSYGPTFAIMGVTAALGAAVCLRAGRVVRAA